MIMITPISALVTLLAIYFEYSWAIWAALVTFQYSLAAAYYDYARWCVEDEKREKERDLL